MIKKRRIIIDTDNGDDIDDLFTLYLALSSENLEIIGITTTFLNTNLRARQIKKVLTLANRLDIPVYAGFGEPLKNLYPKNINSIFCQYSDDLNDEKYAPINDDEGNYGEAAVQFLIDKSKEIDDLTIVCIGPLTNLAKAILKDPVAMRRPEIIMMGGCFSRIEREWNIACDYEAASIVFNSKLNLTAFGVDVTKKTEITVALQERILRHKTNDPYMAYLIESANRWFNSTQRRIVLHDPLTLYYLIDSDIFKFKDYHISVEVQGDLTKALTVPLEELLWVQFAYVNKDLYSRTKCAIDVNADEFIGSFIKKLNL